MTGVQQIFIFVINQKINFAFSAYLVRMLAITIRILKISFYGALIKPVSSFAIDFALIEEGHIWQRFKL